MRKTFVSDSRMLSLNINTFIREGGLSADELAYMAGVSPSLIGKMRRGGDTGDGHRISISSVKKVASVVGVPIRVLVSGIADDTQRKETEEDIIRLYGEGVSQGCIADRLAVDQNFVRRVIAKARKEGRVTRNRRLTDSQIEEIVKMYESGKTVNKIAEEFGVSASPIFRRLKKMGVHPRFRHRLSQLSGEERERIVALYKAGMTYRQIGEEFGIGSASISSIIAPFRKGRKNHNLTESEIDDIVRLCKSGQSVFRIAEAFGVSEHTIYRHLKIRRVSLRSGKPLKLTDKELAEVAEMHINGRSHAEICQRYGIAENTVRNYLRMMFCDDEYSSIASGIAGYEEAKEAFKEATRRRKEKGVSRRSRDDGGAYCVITEKLSRNIGSLIRKSGLTKKEFSELTGISHEIVRNMLSGDNTCRCHRATLERMASAFGVSSDLLLNGDAGELKDAAVAPHHVGSSGYSRKAAITKETRDEIVRLYNSGYGKRRIAEEVAVSLDSVKSIIKKARSSGEAVQRGHGGSYKLTDAQIDQAVGMYETGVSTFQIATMFGVNQKTIRNYIRRKKAKQQSRQEAQRA